MPYVQLDGHRYPLEPGDNPIGAGPGARVRLNGVGDHGVYAVLELADDGTVIVRRPTSTPVLVNGLDILDQPSPLLHGDKLEILGRELQFGDDRRVGSTAFMPRIEAAAAASAGAAARTAPTAATGGRLVSLVDGREYTIPDTGLVLGREPECDVVIPSTEVSRRHAAIIPTRDGYLLTDTSTNGLVVNGERVHGSRILGKGELVRIGDEEFRFHADAAPPPRPLYATLEVRGTGLLSGSRYEARSTVVRIGRGPHNDIVLDDESVSDAHAMLQLRDDIGWCVVDLESTNGTYIEGRRVTGMSPIGLQADLRIAGVKLFFRAARVGQKDSAKGTRVIAPMPPGMHGGTPKHVRAVTPPPGVRAQPGVAPAPSRGAPAIVWILVAGLLGGVAYILLASN